MLLWSGGVRATILGLHRAGVKKKQMKDQAAHSKTNPEPEFQDASYSQNVH